MCDRPFIPSAAKALVHGQVANNRWGLLSRPRGSLCHRLGSLCVSFRTWKEGEGHYSEPRGSRGSVPRGLRQIHNLVLLFH